MKKISTFPTPHVVSVLALGLLVLMVGCASLRIIQEWESAYFPRGDESCKVYSDDEGNFGYVFKNQEEVERFFVGGFKKQFPDKNKEQIIEMIQKDNRIREWQVYYYYYKELSNVDFNKHMVIIAGYPRFNDMGYKMKIKSVIKGKDKISVYVKSWRCWGVAPQAVVPRPIYVIGIEKSDLPVEFHFLVNRRIKRDASLILEYQCIRISE